MAESAPVNLSCQFKRTRIVLSLLLDDVTWCSDQLNVFLNFCQNNTSVIARYTIYLHLSLFSCHLHVLLIISVVHLEIIPYLHSFSRIRCRIQWTKFHVWVSMSHQNFLPDLGFLPAFSVLLSSFHQATLNTNISFYRLYLSQFLQILQCLLYGEETHELKELMKQNSGADVKVCVSNNMEFAFLFFL